jgi:hypothetical protein
MARPDRRRFCGHLLACSPCHLLFNDVRAAIDDCHEWKGSQMREIAMGAEVERRIIRSPGRTLWPHIRGDV